MNDLKIFEKEMECKKAIQDNLNYLIRDLSYQARYDVNNLDFEKLGYKTRLIARLAKAISVLGMDFEVDESIQILIKVISIRIEKQMKEDLEKNAEVIREWIISINYLCTIIMLANRC